MKIQEILDESLIDTIKAKLGAVKGFVVSSVSALLAKLKKNPNAILTTIEEFEIIDLHKKYNSRVDTGAMVCSIDASDIAIENNIVNFTHAGVKHKMPLFKVKTVNNSLGSADRPRVKMSFRWNGKTYPDIEVSLADRSKLKFPCLIGRNLIKELKLPVHINDLDQE